MLLTGGASRLGSAVGAALAAGGHAVRGTDTVPLTEPASGWGEFRQGALTDPDFVAPLLEGVQVIVHLAPLALPETMPANAPAEILDAAARGTHVLLTAATEQGVRRVVQGSTLAVMDAYPDDLEVDEQWRPRPRPHPAEMAPYLAELTAREFTRDVQLKAPPSIICLRFARLAVASGNGGETGPPAAPESSVPLSDLPLTDAVHAVQRALDALEKDLRQRGHRWQVYHIAAPAPEARYTSALARQALGYAAPESPRS